MPTKRLIKNIYNIYEEKISQSAKNSDKNTVKSGSAKLQNKLSAGKINKSVAFHFVKLLSHGTAFNRKIFGKLLSVKGDSKGESTVLS